MKRLICPACGKPALCVDWFRFSDHGIAIHARDPQTNVVTASCYLTEKHKTKEDTRP